MGSNRVDFLNPTLKITGIEDLFIKPLKGINDQLEYYHNYVENLTSCPVCYKADSDDNLSKFQ
eukprot:3700365-Ditylum_brightwellii.AAC.1